MCCSSCRDTSEPSEIPSSTSTVWVRIGGMVSGRPAIAAMPTAIMAPEISPPGRLSKRNSAPPAVPMSQRFEHVEDFGAAGNGKCHRCGDLAHAALWQIPARGTNAPTQLQQCAIGYRARGFAGIPRECGTCRISRRYGAITGRRMTDHSSEPVTGLARRDPVADDDAVPWSSRHDHFALSAAVFLHSDMNFLRSLP